MYFSDAIRLIEQTFAPDENAIERVTSETVREIYGDIESVTHEEIKIAEQRGFNAVCRIKVWAEEYNLEKLADIGDQRLEVYRTYKPAGDKIELYLGEKVGLQDGAG